VDIQREEAAQDRRREQQVATQAAAHATAVAAAGPTQGPSTWGKAVLRAVPSAGLSSSSLAREG